MKIIINYIKSNIGFSIYVFLLLSLFGLAFFHQTLLEWIETDYSAVLSEQDDVEFSFEVPEVSSFKSQDISRETEKLLQLADNIKSNHVSPDSTIRLSAKSYPNLVLLLEAYLADTPQRYTCSISEKSFVDQELIKYETNYENANNIKIDALQLCTDQMNELKGLYVDECDNSLSICEKTSTNCSSGYNSCINNASDLYDSMVCKVDFGNEDNIFTETVNLLNEDVTLFRFFRDHCI